jgi:hypothetical protein
MVIKKVKESVIIVIEANLKVSSEETVNSFCYCHTEETLLCYSLV